MGSPRAILVVAIVVGVLVQVVDPLALLKKKVNAANELEGHLRALREVCEINDA